MKTLTKEDLPIGTKVVPHDKTVGRPFEEWIEYRKKYGRTTEYVIVKRNILKDSCLNCEGDFFNYSDVTLYQEQPEVKKSEMLEMIKELQGRVELLEGVKTETIDQPQYEIGAVYAFSNDEDSFDNDVFWVRKLLNVDLTNMHPFQDHNGSTWKFARRIEYTLK